MTRHCRLNSHTLQFSVTDFFFEKSIEHSIDIMFVRWTALMEACNFGHRSIVEILLRRAPTPLDLDAVNLRGQTAAEVGIGITKI